MVLEYVVCILRDCAGLLNIYSNVHLWHSFAANGKASSRKASSEEVEGSSKSTGFVCTYVYEKLQSFP